MEVVCRIEPIIERLIAGNIVGELPYPVSGKLGADEHLHIVLDLLKLAEYFEPLSCNGIFLIRVVVICQRDYLKPRRIGCLNDIGNDHLGFGAAGEMRVDMGIIFRQLVYIIGFIVNEHIKAPIGIVCRHSCV